MCRYCGQAGPGTASYGHVRQLRRGCCELDCHDDAYDNAVIIHHAVLRMITLNVMMVVMMWLKMQLTPNMKQPPTCTSPPCVRGSAPIFLLVLRRRRRRATTGTMPVRSLPPSMCTRTQATPPLPPPLSCSPVSALLCSVLHSHTSHSQPFFVSLLSTCQTCAQCRGVGGSDANLATSRAPIARGPRTSPTDTTRWATGPRRTCATWSSFTPASPSWAHAPMRHATTVSALAPWPSSEVGTEDRGTALIDLIPNVTFHVGRRDASRRMVP